MTHHSISVAAPKVSSTLATKCLRTGRQNCHRWATKSRRR